MRGIKPPFPFPSQWNTVCTNPAIRQYWNVPFHHCPQSCAIRMCSDRPLTNSLVSQNREQQHQNTHLEQQQLLQQQQAHIEEYEEEYMVDFALEMNEEWSARLLATARRLKLISTPKKPSKAKRAHKKKMRAKSKQKKKLKSQENSSMPPVEDDQQLHHGESSSDSNNSDDDSDLES